MAQLSLEALAKLLDGNKDIRGAEERSIHAITGTLGQLFVDLNEPICELRGANNWYIEDLDGQRAVFDTWAGKWVPLTEQLINIIPDTYTFAPRPGNVAMELDYFVRGGGFINHSFVWSNPSIPTKLYAKVATHTNLNFHGRFTVTPWVPKMKNLGQMEKGFYVMDNDDWNFMYGKQNHNE